VGYSPHPVYAPHPLSHQSPQHLDQPGQQGNYEHQQYPPNSALSSVYNEVQGQYTAHPIPQTERNLWVDNDQVEVAVPQAPLPVHQPTSPFPSPVQAPPDPGPTASISAFSFISASPSVPAQVQAPVTLTPSLVTETGGCTTSGLQPSYLQSRPVGTGEIVTTTKAHIVAPPTTIFDTLPPIAPTPITAASKLAPVSPKLENQPSGNRIDDAFAGLHEDEDSSSLYESSGGLIVKTSDIEPIEIVKGPVREVILEADLPPGPLGIILDRSIDNMAVIERFVPMPTGEKGYLELHPAICPGCAMISINSIQLENASLEEVGSILGAQFHNHKILRFKKVMYYGRTVNPATMAVPYVPPPQETTTSPRSAPNSYSPKVSPKACDSSQIQSTTDSIGAQFINKLNALKQDLSVVEQKVQNIVNEQQKKDETVGLKNQLAQLHGDVEKIQANGIDAIILGPNPPPNHEEIKEYRSSLVNFAHELTAKIQRLAISEGLEEYRQPLSGKTSPAAASGTEDAPKVDATSSTIGFIPCTPVPQPATTGVQQPVAMPSPSIAGDVNIMQASSTQSEPSPSQGSTTSTSKFSFISSDDQVAPSNLSNISISNPQLMSTDLPMASTTVPLSSSSKSNFSFMLNCAPAQADPSLPPTRSNFNVVSTSATSPNSTTAQQSTSKASGFSFMDDCSLAAATTTVPVSTMVNAPPPTEKMSRFKFMDSSVSSNPTVPPPVAMPSYPSRSSNFSFISGNDLVTPVSPRSPSRRSSSAFMSSQDPPPATPAPSPISPLSSTRGSSNRFLNSSTSAEVPVSTAPPSTELGFMQPNAENQQAMDAAFAQDIAPPSSPKQQQQQRVTPISGFSFISS
jgi:hypothetical protein